MENREEKLLALVTGASSGIGYELARQFAEHGFDLVIAAEDPGLVECKQAFESLGAEVEAVQVDLASAKGVEELCGRLEALGRPVDAVALNAGVGVGGEFARQTPLAAELNLIQLNVTSVVHLTKRLLPAMVARGSGRLLFTSSIAADMPAPFLAVYGASKAFVQSFAVALRSELRDTGVTVTALQPGATDTAFFERAGMQDTKVGAGKKDDAGEVARQGFEALMKGEEHVVAGSLMNKVQDLAAKLMPDRASAEMHRRQSEPGSAPGATAERSDR